MSTTQPHPGHEKHLCYMVEKEVPTEKLKPLVKNANTSAVVVAVRLQKRKTSAPQNLSKTLFFSKIRLIRAKIQTTNPLGHELLLDSVVLTGFCRRNLYC